MSTRTTTRWSVALLALAACSSASAQFMSGNKLLSDHNSNHSVEKGIALGFVMGVADAGNGILFCAPRTSTAGQLQDMVMATLNNHPEIRHLRANEIIEYTLRRAWPCEKKGSAL